MERKQSGVEDHSLPNRFPLMCCLPPTIEGLRRRQNMIRLMPPASLCGCLQASCKCPARARPFQRPEIRKYLNHRRLIGAHPMLVRGIRVMVGGEETQSAFEPLKCGLKLRSPRYTPRFLPPRQTSTPEHMGFNSRAATEVLLLVDGSTILCRKHIIVFRMRRTQRMDSASDWTSFSLFFTSS